MIKHKRPRMSADFGPLKMIHGSIRVGKRVNGTRRAIRLLKFRTMEVDSHNEKERVHPNGSLLEKFNSHDPRVKWWGYLLRKFHIDETPQLMQVISGELNLVGPRAIIKKEYDKLPKHIKKIHDEVGSSLMGLQYACRPFPPTEKQYYEMVKKFYNAWKRNKNAATLRYGLLILANITIGGAHSS